MAKKLLSIVLAITMAVCLLPANTFAHVYYGGTISSDAEERDDTILLNADTTIAEGVTFALTLSAYQHIELNNHTLTNYGTITTAYSSNEFDGGTFYNYGVCEITGFYKVTVYDLTLSSIALSSGTLSPSFAAGTREYAVTVDNSVTSIDITPTLNTGTGVKSITVNGTTATSGAASTVSLDVGENSIPIVITAGDGSDTTNTYTLTVTREEEKTYTVKWYDDDGTLLETDTDVDYDTMPSYDGKEPTKASDNDYHYTFAGWTPVVSEVIGDADYTATYTVTEHTIETQNTKDATCTEDGYTGDEVCTVCGGTITSGEVIPATGHTAGEATVENEVPATHTTDGSYDSVVYCSECGAEISRETIAVPATGHNYEAVVTDPTCTEQGYTTYTCSVCGDTYTADETEAKGHSYEAVVTDPTCTAGGYTTYTCSVCGYSYTADETGATGHSYEAVVTDPTCTEKGYTTYTCSICGYYYTVDEMEATGHSYDQGSVTKDATCDTPGSKIYTCTVCGDSYTEAIAATGHSYGAPDFAWESDYSTCIATFTCDNDSDHVETADCTVSSKTTAATCTEDGETVYTATVTFNGTEYTDTQTVTISATGHTVVTDEAVAATCTETGLTGGSHCSVCSEVIVAQVEVPATGHAWGETAYTWNEDGSSCTATHTCENDSSHVEEATATIISGQTLDPTCTEKGETTYTATFSEDWAKAQTLTVADVDATGHSYGAPVFTWNGNTCTATFTCAECDDEQTVDATVTSKNFFGMVTRTAEVTFGGTPYTDIKTTGRSLLTIMADYTSVNDAISKANALNASDYSNFADVTAAINAVQWNLNVLNQSTVNGYAEAIETAIANLKSAELTEETVTINEPIEDTNTSTEPDDIEVDDTDEETNPTTGIALAMLPMAIALAAIVAGKRR